MSNLRKTFTGIYDQHVDKIYRFIFLKVSSQEIAEDLCSETFLKGWEAFKKSHNPNPGCQKIENIQAFLYKIAHNLLVDYYRKKDKAKVISAEIAPIIDPRESLEEKAIFSSDFNTVRAALSNLKKDYQEVIIWRYLEDLPISEIAEIVDKSEEAVRVTLHRAMKKLKTELS